MMKYRVKIAGSYLAILILASLLLLIPFATSFLYRKLWFLLFSIFLFLAAEGIMISTLFGYARLDSSALYIRFGFFTHKKIAYSRIKKIERKKGLLFCESLLSLNTAAEYIRIEYDEKNYLTISIRNSEDFMEKLRNKTENKMES